MDITAQVLTQIILEFETAKLDSFPVPLLVRVIRQNDQLVKDFIEKYFNQALKSFLDYQREVEEQIRRTHALPPSFPSLSDWKNHVVTFVSVETDPKAEICPRLRMANRELREMIHGLEKQWRN